MCDLNMTVEDVGMGGSSNSENTPSIPELLSSILRYQEGAQEMQSNSGVSQVPQLPQIPQDYSTADRLAHMQGIGLHPSNLSLKKENVTVPVTLQSRNPASQIHMGSVQGIVDGRSEERAAASVSSHETTSSEQLDNAGDDSKSTMPYNLRPLAPKSLAEDDIGFEQEVKTLEKRFSHVEGLDADMIRKIKKGGLKRKSSEDKTSSTNNSGDSNLDRHGREIDPSQAMIMRLRNGIEMGVSSETITDSSGIDIPTAPIKSQSKPRKRKKTWPKKKITMYRHNSDGGRIGEMEAYGMLVARKLARMRDRKQREAIMLQIHSLVCESLLEQNT